MADTKTSQETISDKIKKFVEDAASLDVLTLTGRIEFSTAPVQTEPESANQSKKLNFKWDGLFDRVIAGMAPNAEAANKLTVIAYTHAEFDFDSVCFVQEGLSTENKQLLAAHHAAVEAAQKSRFEAVRIVTDLLGGFFPGTPKKG